MYTIKSKMKDAENVIHETEIQFPDTETVQVLDYYESLFASSNVTEASVVYTALWFSFKREDPTISTEFKPASGKFYL